MSIHGVNQVYVDNAGTPEKLSSNTNGGAQVTLYKADGTAYAAGDEATSLPVVSNYREESGDASSPTMGDITQNDGTALEAADYTITDTTNHQWWIPVGSAGYRECSIALHTDTAFDQNVDVTLFAVTHARGSGTAGGFGQLAAGITLTASTTYNLHFGAGAAGQGAVAEADPASTATHFQIDAMAHAAALVLRVTAASNPGAGTLFVDVTRW